MSPTEILLLKRGRVNVLCVVSRAREAEAERGKSGPGGGAGAAAIFCFG